MVLSFPCHEVVLCLCAVFVSSERISGTYFKRREVFMNKIIQTDAHCRARVGSRLDCGTYCNQFSRSISFFYNKVNQDCVCPRITPVTSDLVPAPGYALYSTKGYLELGVSNVTCGQTSGILMVSAPNWFSYDTNPQDITFYLGRRLYIDEIRIPPKTVKSSLKIIWFYSSSDTEVWVAGDPEIVTNGNFFIPDVKKLSDIVTSVSLKFHGTTAGFVERQDFLILAHE
ncbi:uncharacterized protein LOC124127996 [Haliotis rufescens]|uniref:uncharacterized protein LOC124127996 n=1 Tax=Haliotis rufescens TaxID=6454 RepID=UPI00201E8235|nr:uncharacterized protein LOC124127996 [Haliotis rufescens]